MGNKTNRLVVEKITQLSYVNSAYPETSDCNKRLCPVPKIG